MTRRGRAKTASQNQHGHSSFVFGMVIMIVMLAGGAHIASFLASASGQSDVPISFRIQPDETLAQVASRLAEQELIENEWYFVLFGRLTGSERHLKPGEYAVTPSMRPLEMLHRFRNGLVIVYDVTIPEGYNIRQIADAFQTSGVTDADELLQLAESPDFTHSLGIEATTLEGYLFPDTYSLPRGIAAADVLRLMVERFRKEFYSVWSARAMELGFSVHEVVTLASIVEKETGAGIERPVIAGVFHNRLRRGMRLQSDPTVIYPIKDFDGNLRKIDLLRDDPYNTYRRHGLPPGPIASPGRAALEAALYPAPVDYLYFVARNDGTHHFSRTLREHNYAVDQYQRKRNRPRTKSGSGGNA